MCDDRCKCAVFPPNLLPPVRPRVQPDCVHFSGLARAFSPEVELIPPHAWTVHAVAGSPAGNAAQGSSSAQWDNEEFALDELYEIDGVDDVQDTPALADTTTDESKASSAAAAVISMTRFQSFGLRRSVLRVPCCIVTPGAWDLCLCVRRWHGSGCSTFSDGLL